MKNQKLNVLSLFDGVGTAYLALERANIQIENYYSSEIDKSALAVLNHHYSANTKFHQVGDVKTLNPSDYLHINLVIFGSPCTQLSSVNTVDRSGLDGQDSGLFYEATRILRDIAAFQPINKKVYFLMENVASMSNQNRDKITAEFQKIFINGYEDNVRLYKINSALVSGANRRRYYWTNIPNVTIPEEKNIQYQDVLVNGYTDRKKANVILSSNVTLTNGINRFYKRNIGNIVFRDKHFAVLPTEQKLFDYPFILSKSGYKGKAKVLDNSEYDFPNGCYRLPSVLECERLMTFPDGYISRVDGVSKTEKKKLIGLSFTCDVISHLLRPLKDVF